MTKLIIRAVVAALAVNFIGWSCTPHTETPKPMKSAAQAGCLTVGEPVALECLEQGERCITEDGNDGAGKPCWWVDPTDGRVWYRP